MKGYLWGSLFGVWLLLGHLYLIIKTLFPIYIKFQENYILN